MTTTEPTIFLCYGSGTECVNCGGYAGPEMEGRVEATDYGGPWCELDCHDEYLEFVEREKQGRLRLRPRPATDHDAPVGTQRFFLDDNTTRTRCGDVWEFDSHGQLPGITAR